MHKTRRVTNLITAARKALPSSLASSNPARIVRPGATFLAPALRAGAELAERLTAAGGEGGLLGKSFLLMVALPSFIFWCYAAFWQSDGYVAETRLTVRAAQEHRGAMSDAASLIGKLSGGPKSTFQDSYIVLNYIKSRAIIVDIGGRQYLEGMFAQGDVDYFSRLKRDSNLEDLWKYWTRHVTASVDTVSGILTLHVEAFRPQASLQIAKDIIRLSEELINQVTVRNRKDAVARAELEVSMSSQRLAEARDQLLQFRNQNVLIDPGSRAANIGELIGKLTIERIDIENALSTFSGTLSADSPSQRVQRARLAALDHQIAELKKKLTDSRSNDAASAQIASYERLKLDEQFTEKLYTIAQNSYQKARQELEKQQLYLVVVVTPTLPESATYPKVSASTLLLFGSLLMLWAIGALIAAGINDHMV